MLLGGIVVGNEGDNSRTGESSAATLDFILGLNEDKNSDFYGKIDTANIGIGGHSQGGVGAFNAVTEQANGNLYKAIWAASTTSPYWGQDNVFGSEWCYDLSARATGILERVILHIPTKTAIHRFFIITVIQISS